MGPVGPTHSSTESVLSAGKTGGSASHVPTEGSRCQGPQRCTCSVGASRLASGSWYSSRFPLGAGTNSKHEDLASKCFRESSQRGTRHSASACLTRQVTAAKSCPTYAPWPPASAMGHNV